MKRKTIKLHKWAIFIALLLVAIAGSAGVIILGNPESPPAEGDKAAARDPQSSGRVEAAGPVALSVVPQESVALYRVREEFVNVEFPVDAVGRTSDVTGAVVFDAQGAIVPGQSAITVNLTTLQSDRAQRDNFIKRNTLDTARYPETHFIPTKIDGLPYPLPTEGQAPVTIRGELTIRNVTRPVEWSGTAYFTPDGMRVEAATQITFQEFEMTKPRVGFLLSVADEIRLEADITFRRSS
ncbi:MAG TPA: YceI family protein [Limnochordia bacterium]|nr:YceI family protein [Limnochordia bacterium]